MKHYQLPETIREPYGPGEAQQILNFADKLQREIHDPTTGLVFIYHRPTPWYLKIFRIFSTF